MINRLFNAEGFSLMLLIKLIINILIKYTGKRLISSKKRNKIEAKENKGNFPVLHDP